MALTVVVQSYKDNGDDYFDKSLGNNSVIASYVPTTGTGTGGGGTGTVARYVTTSSDQHLIWGYKTWKRNQIIDASLFVVKDVCINGDLFVGGNLNGGNLILQNLTVNNDVSISGDLFVSGSLNGDNLILQNLTVTNDVSISGDLWVDGEINGGLFGADVEIGNNLTVGGDVSILGTLYVIDLCTNSFTTYDTSTQNWYVSNDVSINNSIYITNNSYIAGDSYITQNSYITGSTYVTNNSYFNADVCIGNNLIVLNDISIGGSIIIAQDLSVGGELTVNYLHVINDVSVDGTLIANDIRTIANLAVGTTASITGDTSIGGDLRVTGNIYLDGNPLGFKLSDLSDVSISSSVVNLSILQYDATSGVWYNDITIDIDEALEEYYIDGSLAARDISINNLNIRLTSVEASLGAELSGAGEVNKLAFWNSETVLTYDSSLTYDGYSFILGGTEVSDPEYPAKLEIIATDTSATGIVSIAANIDNYAQIGIRNDSSLISASTDVVAEADNASETTNYIDMGINGSGYNAGFVGDANDAYLYNTGKNLLIGNVELNYDVVIFSGGSDAYANERLRIQHDGKLFIGQPDSTTYPLEVNGDINVPVGSTYRIGGVDIGIVDVTKAYVDGSLGKRDVSIAYLDASVRWLYQNPSGADVNKAYVDGSLGARDISIGYLDASLTWLYENINISGASVAYVDGSLAARDVSIAYLDASVRYLYENPGGADVNKAYVDGSLGERDTSIAWLNTNTVKTKSIGLVIDGGGTAITTGSKGYREIDDNYTIDSWTLLSDVAGSIVIDVKNSTYATWPTTVSISGSEKPTLTGASKNKDTDLTTWVKNVSTGDILEFNVESAETVTKVWLFLTLNPR